LPPAAAFSFDTTSNKSCEMLLWRVLAYRFDRLQFCCWGDPSPLFGATKCGGLNCMGFGIGALK